MEIRVLRYFLAVAREGNITSAANYLHLTQPTLSRQIRDLEDELGQQLLIRKSHRVALTPAGMLFRKRAEEIVIMADRTEEEFRTMKSELTGDIYIGGGETDAMNQIAAVCRELQMTHPGIHYHLYSGNAQAVTERLDKGLLDFGILIQPTDLTKYHSLTIPAKDTWGLIMRKDCPLAEKADIELPDLLPLPLIFSQQVLNERVEINELAMWFGSAWGNLNIVATFNLAYNAAIMAKQGVGYVLGLDKLADTSESSPLCFRQLAPRLESGLDLVWKKYQVFSPAADVFLEKLQTKFS